MIGYEMKVYHQLIYFLIGLFLLVLFIQYAQQVIPANSKPRAVVSRESFTDATTAPETKQWNDVFISPLYAQLYNKVFSADEYYQKQVTYILAGLEALGKKGWKNGVELGTGTGRHYQFLQAANRGSVMGIDSSGAMIEIAQSRNPRGEFWETDFRAKNLWKDGTVDVFFVMGETFYLNGGAEQELILRNLHQALANDGIIVLDFWNHEGGLDPAPQPYSQILENGHAATYFENLEHEAWFEPQKTVAPGVYDYEERFTVTNERGEVKKHEEVHRVFLPPNRESFMDLLDLTGFKVTAVKKMGDIGFEDHEIFFLQKK